MRAVIAQSLRLKPAVRPAPVPRERPGSRAGIVPAVILALAALTYVWTRMVGISVGLYGDEVIDVFRFIHGGPATIWGPHYIPDDHMLFNLLEWAQTNLLSDHSNAAYRFWALVPAATGGAVVAWWLWHEFHDLWFSAMFAVLATGAPLFHQLGTAARGYGICFLTGALAVIFARAYYLHGRPRDLIAFTITSIAGIWTLPVFALSFATGVLLLLARRPRRPVLVAAGIVGLASLAFYAPVLSLVLNSSSQKFGTLVPIYGGVTRTLGDLLAPSVRTFLPHVPLWEQDAIVAVPVIAGAVVLYRRWERFTLAAILLPPVLGYTFLWAAGWYVEARFLTFALLPLLALAAIGLVGIGRALVAAPGNRRMNATVAVLAALFLTLWILGRLESSWSNLGVLAVQDYQGAAEVAKMSNAPVIVTNYTCGPCFAYYLGPAARRFHIYRGAVLEHYLCSFRGRFAYMEFDSPKNTGVAGPGASTSPSTACLVTRGAFYVTVRQRAVGTLNRVWLVPTLPARAPPTASGIGPPGGPHPAATRRSRARR